MQSPDGSTGYITAMDDLLNEFFPEPMTQSSPEYVRLPLLSYMLADLETKGHRCKACKTQDLLRFFIINEHTEIFKCGGRQCMFPFRSFVFRDRRDQSYFTFKPEVQPIPLLSMVSGSPQKILSPSHNASFDAILSELFPGDSPSSSQELPTSADVKSTCPPPSPEKKVIPPTLSKTLDLMAKKKGTTGRPPTPQRKNIKSPLELVKDLLQRKGTPKTPDPESLVVAHTKLKGLEPLMSQPLAAKQLASPSKGKTNKTPSQRAKSTPKSKALVRGQPKDTTTGMGLPNLGGDDEEPDQEPVQDRPKRTRRQTDTSQADKKEIP